MLTESISFVLSQLVIGDPSPFRFSNHKYNHMILKLLSLMNWLHIIFHNLKINTCMIPPPQNDETPWTVFREALIYQEGQPLPLGFWIGDLELELGDLGQIWALESWKHKYVRLPTVSWLLLQDQVGSWSFLTSLQNCWWSDHACFGSPFPWQPSWDFLMLGKSQPIPIFSRSFQP